MTELGQTTFQTLDIWLSSFLALNCISARLEVNNGKVVLTFPLSDALYKVMINYNSNVKVPVTDFIASVKTFRGQMLSQCGGRDETAT